MIVVGNFSEMTPEEITILAEKEVGLTKSELENKLTELKALNFKILECILYVKANQNCSLIEAKKLVVNSTAWIDKKDEFVRHQQEQTEEFIAAASNDIQEIEHVHSSEKMEIKLVFKPNE